MTKTVAEKVLDAENSLFTNRNARIWGIAWLVLCGVALIGYFRTGDWPYLTQDRPTGCVDIGWLWISGRFAASHNPAGVFDFASFAKAQVDLFGAGTCKVWARFPYPPTLLFFTYPLGLVSFVTAYVLWNMALAVLFLGAIYAIVHRANAVLAAPPMRPAAITLYLGHTAFLTAGLFGFALTLLEIWPVTAGFLLALLTYKPQFGMLIPIALIASRNWRALVSAISFSLVLAGAAALAFGVGAWSSFLSILTNRNANLSPDAGYHLQLTSLYGILQWTGVDPRIAWAAHGTLVVFLAAAIWVVWSKPIAYPVRASLLCVASFLATPYVLYYDLCLLAIAFAFLVSDGLRRGFLAGERTVMFVCWIALNYSTRIAPVISCGVLLLLLYRRVSALGQGRVELLYQRTGLAASSPTPPPHAVVSTS